MTADDEHGAAGDARAQLSRAWSSFQAGRLEDALAECQAVIRTFGSVENLDVQERVALALLREGLCLGGLKRPDEEAAVYEQLITRFGESTDPRIRRHVAWGRYNQAVVWRNLGRPDAALAGWDALVARFHDAADKEVRLRVSWSLWHRAKTLEDVGRLDEAETTYGRLAARRDEGLDGSLDLKLAWCIEQRPWRLWRRGEDEMVIAVCEDLLERYADAADPGLRPHLLAALRLKAHAYGRLGQRDRELATLTEVVSRFEGESDPDLRDKVADSLRMRAVALADGGQIPEAVEAYDQALAYLAATEGPQPRERVIDVLFSKAVTLGRSDHAAEAVVVYDSIASTYAELRARGQASSDALWRAVMGLIHKVELLCLLDRSDEADAVSEQVAELLGDLAETPPDRALSELNRECERALAAKFAEVVSEHEYWRWFGDSRERPPVVLMERWALDLYKVTAPWLSQPPETWDSPSQIAAAFLRELADGYAMLTQDWDESERAALPLPTVALHRRAELIRRTGLEQWAVEFGYTLALPANDDRADADFSGDGEDEHGRDDEQWSSFLHQFLIAAYTYQLLEQLQRSRTGRESLGSPYFRRYACQEICRARRWSRRVGSPQSVGHLTLAWLIIAEELFIAAHAERARLASLISPPAVVREPLRDGGGIKLLLEADLPVPSWIAEDEDR